MIEGVVVNGQVCVANPIAAPDGTRVVIDFLPPKPVGAPFPERTREEDLAAILEGFEDIKAGRVTPLHDVIQEMRERVRQRRANG